MFHVEHSSRLIGLTNVPRGTFGHLAKAVLFHVEHFHNICPFAQKFELSPALDVA